MNPLLNVCLSVCRSVGPYPVNSASSVCNEYATTSVANMSRYFPAVSAPFQKQRVLNSSISSFIATKPYVYDASPMTK